MHGKMIAILLCAWAICAYAVEGPLVVEPLELVGVPPEDLIHNSQKPTAPSYFQALEYFDKAVRDIKDNMVLYDTPTLDNANLNFITIAYTIDGLTFHVAERGWRSYNAHYIRLIKSLSKRASREPEKAAEEIVCVLNASNKQISRLREIMNNKWIDHLCSSEYSNCDGILHNYLKVSDPELRQQANLLLMLGQAGANYLRLYAQDLQNLTKKQAYLYLLGGKHTLKKIVYKNSLARRLTFPEKDVCFV